MRHPRGQALAAGAMMFALGGAASAAEPAPKLFLAGAWVMEQAYEVRADGMRVTNYGEHPRGLLMVDGQGHYSLQIFRAERPDFASGDKTRGTPDEYRQAVLGSSTHFGRISVDAQAHRLTFDIEAASYPNWSGKRQVRDYSYANGLLTYQVPASASGNGTIAYSVWRRASAD